MNRRPIFVSVVVCGLLACTPKALRSHPDAGAGKWARVDSTAASELDKHALVGLAIGVAHQGRVVFTKGYGVEDREARLPVDPDVTLFRWASVSKTVTAAIAAGLAREGVISFDANIATYYPTYAPKAFIERCSGASFVHATRGTVPCVGGLADVPLSSDERATITLRRLGGHLAGIPHYYNGRGTPNPPGEFLSDPQRNTGMESALGYLLDKPLVDPPGKRYSYSSFGFNVLGVVLEKASHKEFGELVESRINKVVGTHIALDRESAPAPRRAVGYTMSNAGKIERQGSTDVSWKAAGGGLISTITDFTRYCAALDGEALLTQADKNQIWTSQKDGSGKAIDYGIGFSIGTSEGGRHISHDGAQEKARTFLSLYPERHLCIVTMTNAEYADVESIASALDRAALKALE